MRDIKDYCVHLPECDLLKSHTGNINCSCGLEDLLAIIKKGQESYLPLQAKIRQYDGLKDDSREKITAATELIANLKKILQG